MTDRRALVVILAAAWELVALATGWVPTITAVVWKLRTRKLGRLTVWLLLGWLVEHLFGEGRTDGVC